jgi:hypothetical protein
VIWRKVASSGVSYSFSLIASLGPPTHSRFFTVGRLEILALTSQGRSGFVRKRPFRQPPLEPTHKERIDPSQKVRANAAVRRSYSFEKVQFSSCYNTGCLGLLAV